MKRITSGSGFLFTAFLLSLVLTACEAPVEKTYDPAADSLRYEGETHLRNVRQLTFGGNNAEAYWSFSDDRLIFQSDWTKINGQGCDQIYVMDPASADGSVESYKLVSTGLGRTTCSYFLPDGKKILFASTHESGDACPAPVMFGQGRYVWPIYETYDIYMADVDGSNVEPLISSDGYDAEATISPDGKFMVFTSTRSGDLELWRYEFATAELLQLTDELGYDGGAFFSHDSNQIVWRASRPTGEEADVYKELLKQNLVEPSDLNVFVSDIDGSNVRQVTHLPGANWAPFFHVDGKRILFTSNHHTLAEGGRIFDIFMIGIDGQNLEQITRTGTFDAFPMFSSDGSRLAFASNRNAHHEPTRDTNIFVADWVE